MVWICDICGLGALEPRLIGVMRVAKQMPIASKSTMQAMHT